MKLLALILCGCVLSAGCSREPEVYPGTHFPAAWLPEGIDKTPFQRTEAFRAKMELQTQKLHFRTWCEKNGFEVDEEVVDSLEFVGGVWVSKGQRLERPSAAEFDAEQTFAGQRWTLVGPAEPNANMFRLLSMKAMWYTAGDDSVRLIDEKFDKLRSDRSVGFERILRVQARRDGQWVDHGPKADWYRDGERGERHYRNDEQHGTQRAWYSNGQLKIEREWRNGQQHGVDRGWYEDGTPSYESRYVAGVEVSGTAWNQDGTLLSSTD